MPSSELFRIKAWLRWRFRAKNRHGVHSPFVYGLNERIFPPQPGDDFSTHPAEVLRRLHGSNYGTIEVTDFGTGASGPRVIADIAKRAAKPPGAGQLLHRIVRHFKPGTMLELGTSLGITTLYQHSASPQAKFITVEGCPQTAALAKQAFDKLHAGIEVRVGSFENELPPALRDIGKLDYVYFDGNHRREPTLAYFETCLPFSHNESLFVFDDIHWSEEMEQAWEEIKKHPQVSVTIDLFHFGLVFFRKEQVKEDFIIRY